MVGDVLISSGVVAYLGAFTVDFRLESTRDWHALCRKKGIPCSEVRAPARQSLNKRTRDLLILPPRSFQ